MSFKLPKVYINPRISDLSEPYTLLTSNHIPAVNRLSWLFDFITNAERQQTKPEKNISESASQIALFQDNNPASSNQLSLFEIQQSNKADIVSLEPNDIISEKRVKKWQKKILKRCKIVENKKKRTRDDVDYYLAVFSTRKLLGLLNKDSQYTFDPPDLSVKTHKKQTLWDHVEQLQRDPDLDWLGYVFERWLSKSQAQWQKKNKHHKKHKITPLKILSA